jgi:hypothetical protein
MWELVLDHEDACVVWPFHVFDCDKRAFVVVLAGDSLQ